MEPNHHIFHVVSLPSGDHLTIIVGCGRMLIICFCPCSMMLLPRRAHRFAACSALHDSDDLLAVLSMTTTKLNFTQFRIQHVQQRTIKKSVSVQCRTVPQSFDL